MKRPDITDEVVHFVKGGTWDEALGIFRTIIGERQLKGGLAL